MSIAQTLMSLLAAGSLLVSAPLKTAAPQHDAEGLLFLCNREYMISEFYVPPDLRQAEVPGQVRRLREETAAALEEMYAACKEETGRTLTSVSGYRAYSSQMSIWKRKLRSVKGNVEKAQEYVAPPGASEHQTGLVMDVGQKAANNLEEAFGKTEGGRWMRENSWRFGFVLRYDQGWEDITGYSFEPWHFRYVGREHAKAIHEAGVPLETWLAEYRLSQLKLLAEKAAQPESPAE